MFDQHNRFGFPNRSSYGGQVYCHYENDCLYYDGWNGTRVDGVSDPCLLDYCIEAVSYTHLTLPTIYSV